MGYSCIVGIIGPEKEPLVVIQFDIPATDMQFRLRCLGSDTNISVRINDELGILRRFITDTELDGVPDFSESGHDIQAPCGRVMGYSCIVGGALCGGL